MSVISVLHLSDLHYSKSGISALVKIREALMNDLDALRFDKGVKPDLVVFSGDMLRAGHDIALYQDVYVEFFWPVLEKLGLDSDRLFVVPGNHDINRSEIDKAIEVGLKSSVKDTSFVNDMFMSIESKSHYFGKLSGFNDFLKNIKNENVINSNDVYSTYSLNVKSMKIGLACLNSVWSLGGESKDYGQVMVGKKQVEIALNDINNCDIKIAVMHHPIEWISVDEQDDIKNILYSNFDFLLLGHTHKQSGEHLVGKVGCELIISNGGCLFGNVKYFNGYSLLVRRNKVGVVNCYLRSYYPERDEFDVSTFSALGGECQFVINKEKGSESGLTGMIKFSTYIKNEANKSLLTNLVDTCAPKNIKSLIVLPDITESKRSYEDFSGGLEALSIDKITVSKLKEDDVKIKDLIEDENNYLLMGGKESGKSALLHYFAVLISENINYDKLKIPLLVDLSSGLKGEEAVMKQINSYYYQIFQDSGIDIKSHLENGSCVILADEISIKEKKNRKHFKSFCEKYGQNKFIMTMTDTELFGREELPEVGVEYKELYINDLRERQVSVLVEKWFSADDVNMDYKVEKVLGLLRQMNIPKSPVIISIVLWVLEKQGGYSQINKSTLLERFIESLLKKASVEEIRTKSLDYRHKELFLSFIASKMAQNQEFDFKRCDLEELVLKYFKKYDLNYSSSAFIDYFIHNGVLIDKAGVIAFKLSCFFEYFIAVRMRDSKDFYDFVVSDQNYLLYINELDYYSGLKRNDVGLLRWLDKKIRSSFESFVSELGLKCSYAEIDEYFSEDGDDDMQMNEVDVFAENLNEVMNEFSDEDVQSISSFIEKGRSRQDIVKKEIRNINRCFVNNLILFSRVLKNSEIVEGDIKNPMIIQCVKYWCDMLITVMKELGRTLDRLMVIEKVKDLDQEDIIDEDLIDKYMNGLMQDSDFFDEVSRFGLKIDALEIEKDLKDEGAAIKKGSLLMLMFIVQSAIFESLGTEKMSNLLTIESKNQVNDVFVRYVLCVLYADLELPGYILRMQELLHEVSDINSLRIMLIIKSLSYYILKDISQDDVNRMEELLYECFEKGITYKTGIGGKIGKVYESNERDNAINKMISNLRNIRSKFKEINKKV